MRQGDEQLSILRRLFADERTNRGSPLVAAQKGPQPQRRVRSKRSPGGLENPSAHLSAGVKEPGIHRRLASGFLPRSHDVAGAAGRCGGLGGGRLPNPAAADRSGLRHHHSGRGRGGLVIHVAPGTAESAVRIDQCRFWLHRAKQLEAGAPDAAEWCARKYAGEREKQVLPLANLVEILYGVGKKEESRTEFEKLRSLAGAADLDAPPLARLAPIARAFGFPTDWRSSHRDSAVTRRPAGTSVAGTAVVATLDRPRLET